MHWDDNVINLEDKIYLAGYIIGVFSAGTDSLLMIYLVSIVNILTID